MNFARSGLMAIWDIGNLDMPDSPCWQVLSQFMAEIAFDYLAVKQVHLHLQAGISYTPKTNGKVERFVQTSLREWAYVRPYESSAQRQAALKPFIDGYNWLRPHSALNHQPPMSRIPAMNNLLKLDT